MYGIEWLSVSEETACFLIQCGISKRSDSDQTSLNWPNEP